jgi:lysophospholipase L1-like esterase
LAQVYDDIWESSFGSLPKKYNRWIAGKRLSEICEKANIYYVDTTARFVEEVKQRGKWLHFPQDAHPTVEGHKIIANEVLNALKEHKLVDNLPPISM